MILSHGPKRLLWIATTALSLLALQQGCSSDDNPAPTQTFTTSSSGTTTSTTTTGPGGGGAGGGGVGGGGGQGGSGGQPNCDGPDGCYNCPPTAGDQFLNACTDAQCSKFDNVARLPLYNNGNLPPLP